MARILTVVGAGPEPALSPVDLALLRGEAVFETLRVYGGRPFRLQAHLDRLARSAAALDLELPTGVEELALRAVETAGASEAVLRLVCTRGAEDELVSAAFAIVSELPGAYEEQRSRGLRLVTLSLAVDPLLRAASPWLLPGIKSTSYAVNMAATREAQARGADDAVFTGLGGELLEAPTANVWWRVGPTLYTPSLDLGILAGVTRSVLLELAGPAGFRVVEGVFDAGDLAGAEEAFLSSSVREVMPVVEVDRRTVGDGRPGPAAATLREGLRALAARQAVRSSTLPG